MRSQRRNNRRNDERLQAPGHTNLKMTPEVFELRRKVMNHLYDARNLLNGDMARVDVRITECENPKVLGSARMNRHVMWIPAKWVKHKNLRATIFHELLHALIGLDHVKGCLLMDERMTNITPAQQNKLFLHYMSTAA